MPPLSPSATDKKTRERPSRPTTHCQHPNTVRGSALSPRETMGPDIGLLGRNHCEGFAHGDGTEPDGNRLKMKIGIRLPKQRPDPTHPSRRDVGRATES